MGVKPPDAAPLRSRNSDAQQTGVSRRKNREARPGFPVDAAGALLQAFRSCHPGTGNTGFACAALSGSTTFGSPPRFWMHADAMCVF